MRFGTVAAVAAHHSIANVPISVAHSFHFPSSATLMPTKQPSDTSPNVFRVFDSIQVCHTLPLTIWRADIVAKMSSIRFSGSQLCLLCGCDWR